MRNISFLPPQSAQKTEKDRKLVQSRIRAHTAQHRLQQEAKKKQQAAAEYWRKLEQDGSDHSGRSSSGSPKSPTSPQTILKKGNSDPFNAHAVTISPRLNQILSFYTTNFLPTYYDIATIPSPSTQAILKYRHIEASDDYNSAVGVLQHQSAAHGFFLAYGEIMADLSADPDLRLEMMKLKSLAVTALQAQIHRHSENDPRTLDAVLLLFQAAVFAGSYAEAAIHGRTLRRLLYQKALHDGPQSVDVGHLFQALWLNLSLSATFLTPTLLDVDFWAPSIFAAVIGDQAPTISHSMTSASSQFPCLDPCIFPPLRNIFDNCRHFLHLYWTLPSQTTHQVDTANLFTYLYSEFFIHSSRLTNHLVAVRSARLTPELHRDENQLHERVFKWHTEHVLSSALLVLMSASTATILHAGRALLMATNLLLLRLKEAIEPVLKVLLAPGKFRKASGASGLELSHPRDNLHRAALWALFLGAVIDHIPKSKLVHGTEGSRWFTDMFMELVQHGSWQTAQEVQDVLNGFIFAEDMLRNEEFWRRLFDNQKSGSESTTGGQRLSQSPTRSSTGYPSPASEGSGFKG